MFVTFHPHFLILQDETTVTEKKNAPKRTSTSSLPGPSAPKIKKTVPKQKSSSACDQLSIGFMDQNAFVNQTIPPATYDGQNNARFMQVLKEQGVTVAMRHMKG